MRVKDGSLSPREIKDELLLSDQTTCLNDFNTHVSSNLAAKIASYLYQLAKNLGHSPGLWPKRYQGNAIQSLVKEMTRPVFGSIPCSLCDQSIPALTSITT